MNAGEEYGGPPPAQVPAGWFQDPRGGSDLRYWDGRQWTDFVAPLPPAPAAPAATVTFATAVAPSVTFGTPAAPTVTFETPSATSGEEPPRSRRTLSLPGGRLAKVGAGLAGVLLLVAVLGRTPAPSADPPAAAAADRTTSAPVATSTSSTTAPAEAAPTPTPTAASVVPPATAPALAGLTLAQASARLSTTGLVMGTVQRIRSAAAPGTVLSQGLAAGKSATKGARVNLVVSAPWPKTPAMVGRSGASAAAALRSAGFVAHVTTRTVSRGTNGAVLSQSPAAGAVGRPGASVTLVVAKVVTPPPAPKPKPKPKPVVKPKPSQSCTPGYDPCLPPASDYDCAGGSGNGPEYVYGVVRVTGDDPYGLDRDGDGYGCE